MIDAARCLISEVKRTQCKDVIKMLDGTGEGQGGKGCFMKMSRCDRKEKAIRGTPVKKRARSELLLGREDMVKI